MRRMLAVGRQAVLEVGLYLRPVVVRDRVVRGISNPGLDQHVLPKDPLEGCGQGLESASRFHVPRVGLEFDPHRTRALEGELQHQELRLNVRAARPGRTRQPGVAYFDATMLGTEEHEAGAAEYSAAVPGGGHERRLALRCSFPQPVFEPAVEVVRLA